MNEGNPEEVFEIEKSPLREAYLLLGATDPLDLYKKYVEAEQLFIGYILSQDKTATNLATAHGGYGASYQMLSGLHGKVRKYADALMREKNMNIVFLAHSEIENINLPDHSEFNRYEIKLHKKSQGHYIGNVDLVGFLKLDISTKKDGRAIDSGERVLICNTAASNISKRTYRDWETDRKSVV